MDIGSVKALTFDVFGTVVDWRSSIIREGEAFGRARGLSADWAALRRRLAGSTSPRWQQVRTGERAVDASRRPPPESLERSAVEFGITGVWRGRPRPPQSRVAPPGSLAGVVAGLTRLRARFILATLSNGNVALMVNMAKRAGLPWDAILGAEVARHYKPEPAGYLATADFLGLRPDQCLMVAAHNGDLVAAAGSVSAPPSCPGPPSTARGRRPTRAPRGLDVVATDFQDLAHQLGC